MTFTTTPPTKPGDYAWRLNNEATGYELFRVRMFQGQLVIANVFTGPGENLATPADVKGQWALLVPAEEIKQAFMEGFEQGEDRSIMGSGSRADTLKEYWTESRAKRIAEGEEV